MTAYCNMLVLVYDLMSVAAPPRTWQHIKIQPGCLDSRPSGKPWESLPCVFCLLVNTTLFRFEVAQPSECGYINPVFGWFWKVSVVHYGIRWKDWVYLMSGASINLSWLFHQRVGLYCVASSLNWALLCWESLKRPRRGQTAAAAVSAFTSINK